MINPVKVHLGLPCHPRRGRRRRQPWRPRSTHRGRRQRWPVDAQMRADSASLWCLAAPALEQKLSNWLRKPLPGLSRKPGGPGISMMSLWFVNLHLCCSSSLCLSPPISQPVCFRVLLDSSSYLQLLLPGFVSSCNPTNECRPDERRDSA